MAGSSRSSGQAGFTLLEIIVALAVLGLLLVGLSQGVHLGLGLWHAQARRIDSSANLDAVERSLRRLLSDLPTPIGGSFPRRGDGKAMQGGADEVSFLGNLPTGFGTTRRAEIKLELRHRRLVLQWTPYSHAVLLGPKPQPAETDLVDGVERLELAYWGAHGRNQGAGWQSQWKGRVLPELIRIRLVFAKDDPRQWPDLIVAPRR